MNLLAPGNDPAAVAFFGYWHLAFLFLCPLGWWLGLNSRKPWMARAKRPVIGLLLAVALGSVLIAAEVPNYDYCKQFQADGMPWWELIFLGCW